MPKFLDAPQWYNETGNSVTGSGVVFIEVNGSVSMNLYSDLPADWSEVVFTFAGASSSLSLGFMTAASGTDASPKMQITGANSGYPPLMIKKVDFNINTLYYYIKGYFPENGYGAIQGSFNIYPDTGAEFLINGHGSSYYKMNLSAKWAPDSYGDTGMLLMSNGSGSTPVWRALKVNGNNIGSALISNSIYAPVSYGDTSQVVGKVGASNIPVWLDWRKIHYFHWYFDGNTSGNELYFSILLGRNRDMTTPTMSSVIYNMYQVYNNATIPATGKTSSGGTIYSIWCDNATTLGVNELTSNGQKNQFTRSAASFGSVRDQVVEPIGTGFVDAY